MEMNRPHLGVGDALERRHLNTSVPRTKQMARGMEFPRHYAMIYLDHNGELQVKASASIFGCGGVIFTPEVTDYFVKLAAPTPVANMQYYSGPSQMTPPSPYGVPPSTAMLHAGKAGSAGIIPCQFLDHNKRRRDMKRATTAQSRTKSASPSPAPRPRRTILRIGNQDLLRRYYEKAFETFQQLNCRTIAKSYIKLVEPRKQVHYPYNGRKVIGGVSQCVDPEQTKPGWWPLGVLHREPDHLRKRDRLQLLVHILCDLKDTHGVTAERLREAGQNVRRQITPSNRLQVLDEIYFVRQMEERYLDGNLDANSLLQVTQAHLPEAICQDDDLSSGIHAAPIMTLDEELDGQETEDEQNLLIDEGGLLAYPGSYCQGTPLYPTTSDSSGSRGPTFGNYPMNMAPDVLPQEPPSAVKHMAVDPQYMPGYYEQQFVPTEKEDSTYRPGVPHMFRGTQFGY